MSSETHITNNTSQITSRYYLYIIRIHGEYLSKLLLIIRSKTNILNVDTFRYSLHKFRETIMH